MTFRFRIRPLSVATESQIQNPSRHGWYVMLVLFTFKGLVVFLRSKIRADVFVDSHARQIDMPHLVGTVVCL